MLRKFGLSRATLSTALVMVLGAAAQAGVILQGFYWDVPSPAAGNAGASWWWDKLTSQAQSLSQSGFTAVWIPPALKGSSGGYSVGYDPFDDYDLGSKDQKGTIPTRYGNREQLQRACATLRANGLEIYADLVQNHRNGDDGSFNFKYKDAYGNPTGGRFEKGPFDFHPNVPQDPNVPNEVASFGRDLAPINGGASWIFNGLNNAGDWMTKALDLQGYRLDYVQGISTDWLNPFLNYGAMNGKFAVGEYYDYNLTNVRNWIAQMGRRSSAFDFPLRGMLREMCNNPYGFYMGNLDHAGLAGVDPTRAVTFVENHDTDRSEPVSTNKMLAYAYILTSEGYPSVFYRDYSTDPGCYGLKSRLDNLIWIHENLVAGTTTQRWKNDKVFVYERSGSSNRPRVLIGLNNNVGRNGSITQGWNYNLYGVQTGFGPNVQLHDYTGKRPDIWTDGSGKVNLDLPPADDGNGYVVYAPVGYSGPNLVNSYDTTQEYAGAADLDIRPARSTVTQIGRIYSDGVRPILSQLYYDTTGWRSTTFLKLDVVSPAGVQVATRTFSTSQNGATLNYIPSTSGAYTLRISALNHPAPTVGSKYWLKVTYRAPKSVPSLP